MSKTMRALRTDEPGKASVHSDVPIPSLRPDYVLVKTKAVALNPTDWKHIDFVSTPTTVGCDYSGIVEAVGPAVTKQLKKGDRIAGVCHGCNVLQPEDGAFAEYLVAKGDILAKVPDSMSWEDASTLGVAIITVAQGLYQSMGLPFPTAPAKEKFPILIYGASTATGVLGVQFAKLSGLEVIATSAPHNFDFMKSLGADAVFDHYDPQCGAKIREYTKNKLFHAWDCYSEGQSPQVCSDALSSEKSPSGQKPIWGTILVTKSPRDDIDTRFTLAYSVMGEAFELQGKKFAASREDFEYARKFWVMAEKLLAEGKFRPHRTDVRTGGLDGILGGLEDLKNGKVSGKKVVYRIA